MNENDYEPLILAVRNWQIQPLSSSTSFPDGLFELFRLNDTGIVFQHSSNGNGAFDWMAGFGEQIYLSNEENKNAFESLTHFLDENKDWAFGHFSYDLKNSIENLHSSNFTGIDFPTLDFFIPNQIAIHKDGQLKTDFPNENLKNTFFKALHSDKIKEMDSSPISIQTRTSKAKYIETVNKLLHHIHRGDIYEINYCIEFYSENCKIDPIAVYKKLNALTDAPFTVLYKRNQQWLLCGSPERFLQKTGKKLVSQPIKGTRPRGKTETEDHQLIEELRNDPKERSENVMIVDLVRNDLSKSATKGSVKVEELFGIHTFNSVHQMISTISAELNEHTHPVEAIKNAFPMGSMTGAPKVRAMELAEEFEQMKRGLYSGAVGYFTPEMDFDFNVVIRSIQYNAKTGYLSLMVGSAITANSNPELEYKECLLKAQTLFKALGLPPME